MYIYMRNPTFLFIAIYSFASCLSSALEQNYLSLELCLAQ